MKTVIVGGGNLGSSFAQQLLSKKHIAPSDLLVINRRPERSEEIMRELGCQASHILIPEISQASVIVLTVKPQDFTALASELKSFLSQRQIVISMMTGISLERVAQELSPVDKIARLMPNLPFSVGEGMSVATYSSSLTETERFIVQRMFSVLGECIDVDDENLIDVATAVSGSGPGYFFYILTHFYKKTVDLGFDSHNARYMVGQTMLGAAKLFLSSTLSGEELVKKIASKGGTTEAALNELKNNRFGDIFEMAIEKAYLRAKELSSAK